MSASVSSPSAEQPPGDAPVMAAAKTPVGPGRVSFVGAVLAVLLVAVGCVGVRDALVSAGLLAGTSWLEGGVDALDGLAPQWWMVPVGAVLLLLGLWLMLTAVRPRPRTAVRLRSQTGVFLRPGDVGRLAARAAEDVDGVLGARAATTRRAAQLNVTVTGHDPAITGQVQQVVEERLTGIDPSPRVKVTSRSGWTR